jgi:hypothetical protein
MQRHILFLTSTNLACNPRCLKEVRLARDRGMKVTVVAFQLHNWTTSLEARLNAELTGVSFHYLDTARRRLLPWLFGTVLERIGRLAGPRLQTSTFWSAMAMDKRSWRLLRWVRANRVRPDLVVAHNPPAFYAAAWLAKQDPCALAIDIEDYHPGENNPPAKQQGSALLMRSFLPKAAYASFASPLIKEYSDRLTGPGVNGIVVNNSFPRGDFQRPAAAVAASAVDDNEAPLRIVWFSQFIDYGRGLEKILPVLDEYRDRIRLTLIGSARTAFVQQEIAAREYIRCIDAMPEKELHRALGGYDIGLALEDGKADQNRDLCLTNKIWSYLLAGLYIVASDTAAQRRFLQEHPGHGVCTSLSADPLRAVMTALVTDARMIRAAACARFDGAAAAAWENESAVLTGEWERIFSQP